MSLNAWLGFITITFFVSISPGPVMLLALTHGSRHGVIKTTVGIAGVSLGNLMIMAISASALSAIVNQPILLSTIKWLGAIYLVYLGTRIAFINNKKELSSGTSADAQASMFSRSFTVAITNPKGLIFFTALFPQFLIVDDTLFIQFLALAITFLLIDAIWQFIYAFGGKALGIWLRSDQRFALINYITGTALLLSGIFIAVTHFTRS